MTQTLSIERPLPNLMAQIDSPVKPGLPLALRLPSAILSPSQILAGRYFLVRCSRDVGIERDEWSIFLRRPLFVCGRQPRERDDCWHLYLPTGSHAAAPTKVCGLQHGTDAGLDWLARREQGEILNLSGPFGNGFAIQPRPHNLLLLIDHVDDPGWFWQLFFLCEQTLDRGGRVAMILRAEDDAAVDPLLRWLPVQVEVRTAADESGWLAQLRRTTAWADQICAGIPARRYGELMSVVRDTRFHVDGNFVQVLARADLLCGVGACLVCAVPTARGGVTRACVHGPVFDLTELVD